MYCTGRQYKSSIQRSRDNFLLSCKSHQCLCVHRTLKRSEGFLGFGLLKMIKLGVYNDIGWIWNCFYLAKLFWYKQLLFHWFLYHTVMVQSTPEKKLITLILLWNLITLPLLQDDLLSYSAFDQGFYNCNKKWQMLKEPILEYKSVIWQFNFLTAI